MYTTTTVLPAVMLAERIRGAWPSATGCADDVDEPSALLDASASPVWSSVSVPVAFAAAAAPANVITCVSVVLPDRASTVRVSPPVDSARLA